MGRCWPGRTRTPPKHKGIGYFIIDMRADGVEIQPIKTADGDPHFNEVFLADVFVPDEMLLGDPTAGGISRSRRWPRSVWRSADT